MRELKFRVYDKLKKIMVTKENLEELIEELDDICIDENSPYTRTEWWPAYRIKGVFDYFDKIQYYNPIFDDEDMEDRFKIMQYVRTKR